MTKEEILNKKFKMESSDHDTKVFMYDALDAMEEYANIKADQSVIDEATKLSIHTFLGEHYFSSRNTSWQ